MSRLALLCVLSVLVVSSFAQAQIIYEPVRYQYGHQNNVYYYGGSDPLVHYYAQFPIGGCGRWGRAGGWAFASGNIDTHREVANEPTRTFTDSLPYRYTNATFAGYTANDARNDAYCNVPTYFRKADLVAAAVPGDGAWVVPAHAQPIRIDRDTVRYVPRSSTTAPRPLMIIPRDKLQPKQQKQSDKIYASTAK